MAVKFKVDVDQKLKKAIDKTLKDVQDLTIPFGLITQSWFKSNRAIFALSGPGKYPDLSERYKKQKKKAVGFIYPILRRTGRLESSITDPSDTDAISLIINKRSLILGTKVPYASNHQMGLGVPVRPMVLFGPEQVSPPGINRRVDAWVKILEEFALAKSKEIGKTR